MAALALMGTIITGCSSSDDTIADTPKQPENTGKVVTLTTTVGLDGSAAARALTIGGEDGGATTRALTAEGVKTFAADEQIAVVYENSSSKMVKADNVVLSAGDIAQDGKSATITVTLTDPKASGSLKFIYPAAMAKADGSINYDALASQNGTLTTLASDLDFAMYDGSLTASAGLPAELTLDNQLAILAITLKDDATSSNITSSIKGLTVSDGTYTYNVSRSAAAGPIYVAIRPTADATFNVTATDGTDYYVKTLTGKTYEISNGYNVSWLMTKVTKSTPLTMEALTDGDIVVNDPQLGMQYSKNGGAMTDMDGYTSIEVNAGDKVQFYGNSACYEDTSIAGGDATVKVYGNIMSLLDEKGFAEAITLKEEYTFYVLFYLNDKLTDASGLLLPATELAESCYAGMFYNCSSLTAAPATLPATTLADNCYDSMFLGCTSLTTAPVLPATTLAELCYNTMFQWCTNLSAVTCLATDISATDCTKDWLDGVAASGTFTTPSSTDWTTGISGIPEGWTRVNY